MQKILCGQKHAFQTPGFAYAWDGAEAGEVEEQKMPHGAKPWQAV